MEVCVYITGEAWCIAFDWGFPAATCPAAAGIDLASQSARTGFMELSSSAEAEKNQDGHYAHSDVQLAPQQVEQESSFEIRV